MKVVIRVDSSTVIGSGHLMRCLTLAERLRKEQKAEVHFISRDLEGNLHDIIKEAGFFLHTLPCHAINERLNGYAVWLTVSQAVDVAETKAVLRGIGKVDCIVVDNYAIDIAWESEIRPYVDKIFVVDDLANRVHDCDSLLDQGFYCDKEQRYVGLVPKNCELLLGPKYVLLREEFYETRKRLRRRSGELHNLLIFYGGSDPTGETVKAVQAVINCSFADTKVIVIAGSANTQKEVLHTMCERYPFFSFYEKVDNMATLMNEADLMMGAGGSTTWERCFLELPAIVTAIADNQERTCEDCATQGWIDYMGRCETVTVTRLENELEQLRNGRIATLQQNCSNITLWADIEKAYM